MELGVGFKALGELERVSRGARGLRLALNPKTRRGCWAITATEGLDTPFEEHGNPSLDCAESYAASASISRTLCVMWSE
jgi:hypothetical protein